MNQYIARPRNFKHKSDISSIFRIFQTDPLDAIRDEWQALRQQEEAAPAWQREGVARRRMTLLAGYDERQIPALIDKLNSESEELCYA